MNLFPIDERCIEVGIECHQGIIRFWDKQRSVVDSYAFTEGTFEEILAHAIEVARDNPFEIYVEVTGNPLGSPECEYLILPVDNFTQIGNQPRPVVVSPHEYSFTVTGATDMDALPSKADEQVVRHQLQDAALHALLKEDDTGNEH